MRIFNQNLAHQIWKKILVTFYMELGNKCVLPNKDRIYFRVAMLAQL